MHYILALTLFLSVACAHGADMFRFRVTPNADGSYSVEGSVDLFSLTKPAKTARQIKALETAERREGMTMLEVAADHVKFNWGKYLTAVAALAVDRIADNNDWLYYKSSSAQAAQLQAMPTVTVTGDGNTVTVNNQPTVCDASED